VASASDPAAAILLDVVERGVESRDGLLQFALVGIDAENDASHGTVRM